MVTTSGEDRGLIESFYAKVLTAGGSADPAGEAERILAPEWRSIGNYSGQDKDRATFLKQVGGFFALMPDLTWKIEEIISSGDRHVVRSRAKGTPKGPFMGMETNGKGFEIMTIDIHTVQGGKVIRTHHVEDWAGAMGQLRR